MTSLAFLIMASTITDLSISLMWINLDTERCGGNLEEPLVPTSMVIVVYPLDSMIFFKNRCSSPFESRVPTTAMDFLILPGLYPAWLISEPGGAAVATFSGVTIHPLISYNLL